MPPNVVCALHQRTIMSINCTLKDHTNVAFILIFVVFTFAIECSVPLVVTKGASVLERGEL